MYELNGMTAHYEKIEQFSHMGLFSAKKGDTIIIFDRNNEHSKRLAFGLKKLGMNVYLPLQKVLSPLEEVIFFIFLSQLIPLNVAKKNKQKDCFFIKAKNLRKVSSDMIY